MKYIGYSELTNRFYLLPTSKKAVKIDITEDIQEIVNFYKSKPDETPSESEAVELKEFSVLMMGGHFVDENRIGYITAIPSLHPTDFTKEHFVQLHIDAQKYIGYSDEDIETLKNSLKDCRVEKVSLTIKKSQP